MKATIYFVELTKDQREELNREGWGSEIGKAYMAIRFDGQIDDSNRHLIKKAVTMNAENSEQIWVALQNLEVSWCEKPGIDCHTAFPRSMDVGDIIVWEDGRTETCTSVGFKPIEFTAIEEEAA